METEQGSYEGRIKAFVGLFASVEGQMHYCEARLTEIAGELQDIYHEIELGEFPGDEGMRHFYLRIRELRQERRRLKDEMIMLGPFRAWTEKNGRVADALARVQGEMRQAREGLEGRTYVRRSEGREAWGKNDD